MSLLGYELYRSYVEKEIKKHLELQIILTPKLCLKIYLDYP